MISGPSSSVRRTVIPRLAAMCRGGFLGLALLFLSSPESRSAGKIREHDVKAAFLLNFARFVEWPPKAFPTPTAPLLIGIVGDNPFGDVLERTLEHQTVQGRPIVFRHIPDGEELSRCHVLFVSRSLENQYDKILERLQGLPVVTVGETENFVREGGVIGFAVVDDIVRFDINTRAAGTAGLKFSSKLLAVARSITRSP